MKNTKLQSEINMISKCKMITGELYIVVDLKVSNYKELEEMQESILSNLIMPDGLSISENVVYRKDLKVFISFQKSND
jgi:hypothetical protein